MFIWGGALRSGSLVAILTLVLAVGCVSSERPSPEDWSRVYVRDYERVWHAVLRTLAEGGYFVEEQDRDRGLVVAESGEDRSYQRSVLEVRLVERPESVRVDVQARGGHVRAPGDFGPLERAVRQFLDELDRELGG